ncbi:alpha/beta hydrolase [Paramagnetospirillum magneticum]|uniref:Alpha/beta hydrolase n=1 Tax=Paramagnetospirillum magneticum (strain ATCC 700264 / AMB-1) TaxID=342108 RepID=Q2W7G2_PARM1|nr:alpha/beta hydrolase [Paramagnetospirillum magneticum]BAE50213.1 hypothetical protein amb1409 [Paramagnetospirillum magneticum AMB-1]
MIRLFPILAALPLLCGLHASPAAAENRLILYTVGAGVPEAPPPVLARFRDQGWTIRINRVPVDFRREHDFGKALFDQARAARGEGYSRVVLAGRSFGAWVSLIANSSWSTPVDGGGIHAVIALDATVSAETARHGRQWHDYKFMDVIKTQDPTRLGVMVLDGDAEEGRGREDEIRRTLRRPGIPHVVVYEPAPPPLDSEDFARRWGDCLATLLGDEVPSPPANDWCRLNN